MKKIGVIGGGPAGLAAAIAAAKAGAGVVVFEKNSACGRKLLTTGGGRCNLTNARPESEWPPLFGKRGRFITPALERLPRCALEAWLTDLGQPVHCPDGRHVFPISNSARAVRDALLAEAERLGVNFVHNARVEKILHTDNVATAVVAADVATPCDHIILATGGKSYPATGSTWDGARIALALGHRVNPPYPGLVGLRASNLDANLAGLVLPDARVSFRVKGSPEIVGRGELLLTHTGISGPAVLDLSAAVAVLLAKNDAVTVNLAWLADTDTAQWRQRLALFRQNKGAAIPSTLFKEFLPYRLAKWLCTQAGLDDATPLAQTSSTLLDKLAVYIGAFPATITATEGWDRAMITRGGIDLREINPGTLTSKLIHSLSFAGEVIDVDGPCGGYNLHLALATGLLAGENAALS